MSNTKAASSRTQWSIYQLKSNIFPPLGADEKPKSADMDLPLPGGGRRCMNANAAQQISSRWLANGG